MKKILLIGCAFLFLCGCKKESQVVRVMQFNIWQEGTKVPGGYDGIIDQIIASKADLITLSEVRNYNDTRFCDRIIASLKEKGETFYSFYSYDTGILSRYPIIDSVLVYPESGDHGSIQKAVVKIGDREIALYSAHLDYLNCTYYDIKGYDGSTWKKRPPMTDIDSILANNVLSERDDAIQAFIREAEKDRQKNRIIIIGGDFNEPSHSDWTEATKNLYDRQGLIVPWTVSTLLAKANYLDAYRVCYPDPLQYPGITYPADCPGAEISKLTWAPGSDERERIDFIYYSPDKNLQLDSIVIWGPSGTIDHSQRVAGPDKTVTGDGVWPSDHKALLSIFSLK